MNRSGARGFSAAAVIAALSVTAGVFAGTASAATLDRIGQDKTIRIAYRDDAPPFSYKDKIGEPVGFMVDLCREVAKKLADQLHLTSLNVTYVPVTAADRFEAIQGQKADLLCEPTSATLSRREVVDFSIPRHYAIRSSWLGSPPKSSRQKPMPKAWQCWITPRSQPISATGRSWCR